VIIGDLDLDWAEQDPDYLARVKAFLRSEVKPAVAMAPPSGSSASRLASPLDSVPLDSLSVDSVPAELSLK